MSNNYFPGLKSVAGVGDTDPNMPAEMIPPAGKGVTHHAEKIMGVADKLGKNVAAMKGSEWGTLRAFQLDPDGNGPRPWVTTDELGDYPAAKGLEQTLKNAYYEVSEKYDKFIQQTEEFVKSVGRGGSNYQGVGEVNEQNARNSNPTHRNIPETF